ncbi:hypothetical protein O3G_MSEX005490, partial [Manduca sexta]
MSLLKAACVLLICMAVATTHTLHPFSDEFIDLINSKQSTWRAGRNFRKDTSLKHIKGLLGVIKDPNPIELPLKTHHPDVIASLPETFDLRDKWPNCPSLNDIRDQGSCGSCWAFGAVEAMTDRYCIHSNGTKQFNFSAQDLLSCCTNCGIGCLGGVPYRAWQYWEMSGIVSGGPYDSSEGCRPYEIAPCQHLVEGDRPPCTEPVRTPECHHSCIDDYTVPYLEDKQFGKKIYRVSGEGNIRAELYNNGPVEAAFIVYLDFLHYKSGVYVHVEGESGDGHAVKILGWGVENGQKYWLAANS